MLISLKSRSHRRKAGRRTVQLETLESRRLLTAVLSQSATNSVLGDIDVADAQSISEANDNSHLAGAIARIVNGESTDVFPAVGIVNGGCTGTLISTTHVLTAAHCVENGRGGFIADDEGTFNINGQTFRTVKVTVHPQYNSNDFGAGFDLAIMELQSSVVGVEPREILRQAPGVGQMLTLVGFGESGTSQNGSNNDFGNKRVGQTPLEQVTQNHLTWTLDSHNEANTASGDSGGPAFLEVDGKLVIAGVTSGGAGDSHSLGGESFDTRIDTLASWIDSVLGDTAPTPAPNPTPDPTPDPVDDDHVNSPGTDATPIVLDVNGNGVKSGILEEAGDRDVFSVAIAEDSNVVIRLDGADLDTYLHVYDEAGNLVAENDDSNGSLNSALQLDLAAGTYFISAGAYADDEAGDYSVNVQVTAIEDPDDPSVQFVDGQLTITLDTAATLNVGTNADDPTFVEITINDQVVSTSVLAESVTGLTVEGSTGNDVINLANVTTAAFANLDETVVNANAGNDAFFGSELVDVVEGGNGRDTLNTGAGDDVLHGQGGYDRLIGGDGNDIMDGGGGRDWLFGGNGNDHLKGGSGRDRLLGQAGDDTLEGGNGFDLMYGHDGNDVLKGGNHRDTMIGGAGDDTMDGGQGHDAMSGGLGNDFMTGSSGRDSMDGGDGNDTLYGGAGRDILMGRAGDDAIGGQGHRDTISGGLGDDAIAASFKEIDESFEFDAWWLNV